MIFEEILITHPSVFEDDRGELWTLWKNTELPSLNFVHDKISKSKKNVLRGLHGDKKSWKLITCLYGEVYLVIVDFRKDSPNFLKWDSIILNEKNKKQVLVPPSFLNGHLVLSDMAIFHYKWSYSGDYPDVQEQFSLNYKDPILKIDWPISEPILSERDKSSNYIIL
jgi:dTDP-4-dehydrorhamnose 3,5-epimerase